MQAASPTKGRPFHGLVIIGVIVLPRAAVLMTKALMALLESAQPKIQDCHILVVRREGDNQSSHRWLEPAPAYISSRSPACCSSPCANFSYVAATPRILRCVSSCFISSA